MAHIQQQARRLAVQPEASTETVENLVRSVLGGKMRVPSFQRGLKWKAKDVRDLFDSIYVGYPIGALLLQKAPAEAGKVKLGPLQIQAPETQSALWVVDGQQRLVSLAAALGRPVPIPTPPTIRTSSTSIQRRARLTVRLPRAMCQTPGYPSRSSSTRRVSANGSSTGSTRKMHRSAKSCSTPAPVSGSTTSRSTPSRRPTRLC